MTVASSELGSCARSVEQHFHQILGELETMRDLLVTCFDAGPVSAEMVHLAIESRVHEFLARSNVIGAGYVAGRDALSDHELYLAWWQGDQEQLLAESDAPATGAPLDYTRHPWFRTPELTEQPYLVGPYVDFVCSDEYVLTSSMPVISHGVMVGVVGADTLAETFERMIMRPLTAASATVVNDNGRIIASADPHLATGTLISIEGATDVVACTDLPVSIVQF